MTEYRTVESLTRLERQWMKRRYCVWCEAPALAKSCYARSDMNDKPCNMDERRAHALKQYKPRRTTTQQTEAGNEA